MDNIKILYFASLGEQLGLEWEELTLNSKELKTVAHLIEHLVARGENWTMLARSKKLLCSVNHTIAKHDTPVKNGDEIAFFPPVTGG